MSDETLPAGAAKNPDEEQIETLSYAGAVIDKTVEFLIGKEIDPVLIASALLGGALQLLTHSMDDERVLRVLDSARASVLSGELRGAPGAA